MQLNAGRPDARLASEPGTLNSFTFRAETKDFHSFTFKIAVAQWGSVGAGRAMNRSTFDSERPLSGSVRPAQATGTAIASTSRRS